LVLEAQVYIADHDPAFFWIQKWLADHPYSKKATLLTISTGKKVQSRYASRTVGEEDEEEKIEVVFSPAPGYHLICFKKHWILLYRMRDKVENSATEQVYRDLFTFQIFSRNRQIIIDLIEEARVLAFPPNEKAVIIWKNLWDSWSIIGKRLPRPIESVVLQNNIGEDIIVDMETFLKSASWYQERGIPYQRGYLLHGPPGSGKTSLIHAIASKLERDVYILRVSTTTDDAFQRAVATIPLNGVVLLEDIDCVFNNEQKDLVHKDGSITTYLTFSGFLNAIDGISAHEGRILFMTTNHRDKLEPALLRPGRVDKEFHLGDADQDQARRLFLQFFPGHGVLAKRFATQIGENISMAALQGHLIEYKEDIDKAAKWPAPA